MSYPNQPYVPMPQPPRKMGAGKIVAIVFGAVFAVIIMFAAIGAAVSGGSSDDGSGKQEPPAAAQPKDAASADEAADEEPTKEPKKDKPKPKPKPKTYGDGDYVVGEDIPVGTYESAGADSDIFDFCSVTTEPKGTDKFPQLKSANKGERIIITLSESDGTVTVQGCHPLTKR